MKTLARSDPEFVRGAGRAGTTRPARQRRSSIRRFAPFFGVRELAGFTLADVWPHLDLKTLFRLHWGGKGVKDEAWERLQQDEFLPRLKRMQQDAEETGVAASRAFATGFSRSTAMATMW